MPLLSQRRLWAVRCEAVFWRVCMSLGMALHRLARPRPMTPSFRLRIPASFVADSAAAAASRPMIELVFYAPAGYHSDFLPPVSRLSGTANSSSQDALLPSPLPSPPLAEKYPIVVNFHGGGFTLGAPTDDGRWATAVVRNVGAVVVSVGYRLAPEAPFPAAVADAADAIKWLHRHAGALRLDRSRMALSGFSAGGNLCFTAALRLHDELELLKQTSAVGVTAPVDVQSAKSDDDGDLGRPVTEDRQREQVRRRRSRKSGQEGQDDGDPAGLSASTETAGAAEDASSYDIKLRALVAWYPSIDYTRTREAHRASNPGGAAKSISKRFTDLFDAAYLWPLDDPTRRTPASGIGGRVRDGDSGRSVAATSTGSRYAHPYLSPSSASDGALRASLPPTVVLYTCEWDGLHREGEDFRKRLQGLTAPPPPLSSSTKPVASSAHTVTLGSAASSMTGASKPLDVRGRTLPRVRHGWDRSPTFAFRDPGGKRMAMLLEVYEEACRELHHAFNSP